MCTSKYHCMADHLHEQVWIQLLCLPMLNEQQIYLFGQIQNQSNRRSGVQEYFPLLQVFSELGGPHYDHSQCDQMRRNFSIWATFYKALAFDIEDFIALGKI